MDESTFDTTNYDSLNALSYEELDALELGEPPRSITPGNHIVLVFAECEHTVEIWTS